MHNQSTTTRQPPVSDPTPLFVANADLGKVWDCRCELEQLYECVSAVYMLFCCYANEDARSLCVILGVLAEKISECQALLSETITESMQGGKS